MILNKENKLMTKRYIPGLILLLIMYTGVAWAQQVTDTTTSVKTYNLNEVSVTGVKSVKGMGYLDEVNNGVVYSGKKTEVLLVDSIDANTALNNPRQVMGRIPGAVFSETQGSGFPSNGVGFRGLNPSQSVETNTRMNGYNITGDLYGYPE
jgi:Fe(3+) dicitrate transport protein